MSIPPTIESGYSPTGTVSIIEMMDMLLSWFYNDKIRDSPTSLTARVFATKREIADDLKEIFPLLNTADFITYSDQVFEKLLRDGLIVAKMDHLAITVEGILFYQKGGFANDIRRKANEAWLDKKLKTTTVDTNLLSARINKLFWATITVAIISAIPSWIALFKASNTDNPVVRFKVDRSDLVLDTSLHMVK